MDEELELQELLDLRGMMDGELFKKYLTEPMQAELESLKDAYDCDSLKELYRIKGQKKGLKTFLDIVDGINRRIENKRLEVTNLEK